MSAAPVAPRNKVAAPERSRFGPSFRRRPRTWALLLATLHFVLAASFGVLNPLGEAPDEADHWAYIVYLATNRSLPEGPQVTQSKHPPAYHASAAWVAAWGKPDFSFLRANPDLSLTPSPTGSPNFFIHTAQEAWPWRNGPLAFHLARLWTALLGSATVMAAYGLSRSALPALPGFAVLVSASVAFWPEFAFLGGALNNDTPVALWATLALWGGFAVARRDLRAGWWTPLALGLGLLTKLSAAAVWPVVALTIVLGRAGLLGTGLRSLRAGGGAIWRSRGQWLPTLALVFGGALLIISPWLWRNWQLYGDPLGVELARQTIDERLTPWGWADTVWLLDGWFRSFWGKFGAVGHIPYPGWMYAGLALLSLVGLAGLARLMFRPAPEASHNHTDDRPIKVVNPIPFLLLALAGITVAGGIWRYSLIALGTDQGRLLFPALVPIIMLLLLGLRAWIPHPAQSSAGLVFALGLLALTLYGLLGVLRPAYAPPPAPSPTEAAGLPARDAVRFGELTLASYTLDGQPVLYWRADVAPQSDWRAILRVVAEDGSLVWEWRRSPGYGRWSTDRWHAGTLMRDAYAVQWPDWAGPGSYLVEVGLYPFGGEPVLPERPAPAPNTAQAMAAADHPYHYLGRLERRAPE